MARKVLLVEDDEILADVLHQKLKHEGYEVALARDGKAGLERMRALKPDLVLLDIVMPQMNGYEVLEEKFKDIEIRSIPVIVISNSGQPVEISRTTALGAVDHLVKAHISPEEVMAKVRLYGGANGADTGATCKGKKVLLVEDDNFLSDLLARRFTEEDCTFIHAETGERALEIIPAEMPNIVLLDLVLPGIGGFEVLERIKKDEKTKHIPVVVLSNLSQESDIQRAIELGAVRHEVKAHLSPNEIVLLAASLAK